MPDILEQAVRRFEQTLTKLPHLRELDRSRTSPSLIPKGW
jgi:hypothetical protein